MSALAILQRRGDGLADGGSFVGNLPGVQDHEAADEAGIGVVSLDVLAHFGDPHFQVVDAEFGSQDDAIDRHRSVAVKAIDE
jgi:hypothetical protein